MAALSFVGAVKADLAPPADVAAMSATQEVTQEGQGEGVPLELLSRGAQVARPAPPTELLKQRHGRIEFQFLQRNLRRCTRGTGEIRDALAGSDNTEARVARSQPSEQGGKAGVLETPLDLRAPRWVL